MTPKSASATPAKDETQAQYDENNGPSVAPYRPRKHTKLDEQGYYTNYDQDETDEHHFSPFNK